MNNDTRPGAAAITNMVRTSVAQRATWAVVLILAISGIATAISLAELGKIRAHAVDAVERVLPAAQSQHHKAVDAASLFTAYHKLLHGNDHLHGENDTGVSGDDHRGAHEAGAPGHNGHDGVKEGHRKVLGELVLRASSLQALLDPRDAPILDEVVMLATQVVELGREEASIADRLHAYVERAEEITSRVAVIVSDLVKTGGDTLELSLRRMDMGLMRSNTTSGFMDEHGRLSAQIQSISGVRSAANQLVERMQSLLRALIVAEHLDSVTGLRQQRDAFTARIDGLRPLVAQLEGLSDSGEASRRISLSVAEFAALAILFDERVRHIELQQEKGRVSQAVDENLDAVATSLNRAAGKISALGIERIVDRSSVTMVIVSAGIVVTAVCFFLMVALGRRHVLVPLMQASEALDALQGGNVDVSLPPMRYHELESIRQSLARFQISTLELAEMNRRLESEVEERRRSEGSALQARRETLDAIESIADGFALFDADQQLVLCNSRFREFYAPLAEHLVPGLTMEAFLRLVVKRDVYRIAKVAEAGWVRARLAAFHALKGEKALQMRGGRWLSISEFRTEDGGTVCIHSDISEARHSEETLLRRSALVQMLREIAMETNEAQDIEAAIKSCLDKVCAYSGFVIGHAYLPPAGDDLQELSSANLWYLSDARRFARFREVSEGTGFAPGVGLPGRVWSSGEPLWIEDVREETSLPRAAIARELGIGTACAFPVLERDRVVAVLEFFADRVMTVDVPLQNAIANLATQLGRITERKRSYMALTKLRHAVEQSPAMILITDLQGVIEYVNPEFTKITGYQASEAIGRNPSLLKSGEMDDSFYTDLWNTIANGRDWRGEFINRKNDGSTYWASTSISPIRDDAGRVTHYLGIAEDVTERKQSEQQIEHLAHYDALTDLPNRVMFHAQARQILAGARRNGMQVAMLMVDLDDFKDVNDSLGHSTGDRLLQEVALRLQGCMREGDVVARLGGDEFALILPDVEGPDGVATVVRRILESIQQLCHIDEVDIYVNASIGISLFPGDGKDADELLKHADLAMYRAKNRARGTFNFFLAAMDLEVQQRKQIEAEMRGALADNAFHLVYQPQVDLERRRVIGVEALVRWKHPEWGMVSPGEFVPIAEHSGLIVPIGEWVLEEACRQACRWRDAGLPPIDMAVNLSPIQFKHHDLLGMVRGVIERTGIDPYQLTLEITESVVMQETDSNLDLVRQLRELGIRIALDDFGTGYSSLSYLTSLPVDKIKIDRSFVMEVATNPVSERIVHTIVELGSALGKKVNVEGVEVFEQLEVLRRSAVDEIQGFYFSPPVDPAAVTRLIEDPAFLVRQFAGDASA